LCFFTSPTPPRAPPSSPTRRSSDLEAGVLHRGAEHGVAAAGEHVAAIVIENRRRRLRGPGGGRHLPPHGLDRQRPRQARAGADGDRKSTRLNSSHVAISYAVFCLKK